MFINFSFFTFTNIVDTAYGDSPKRKSCFKDRKLKIALSRYPIYIFKSYWNQHLLLSRVINNESH